METVNTLLLIAHVLIGAAIVVLVLLQRGKGAEAGAAFGAGASGTVFGASGSANFLSRSTAVFCTLFFMSSLALAYVARQQEGPASLLDTTQPGVSTSIDALPAPDAAPVDADGLPALPAADEAAGDDGLPALPAEQGSETGDQPVE